MRTRKAVVLLWQSRSTTKSFIHHQFKNKTLQKQQKSSKTSIQLVPEHQSKMMPLPCHKKWSKKYKTLKKKIKICPSYCHKYLFMWWLGKEDPNTKTRSFKGWLRKIHEQRYCSPSFLSPTGSRTAATVNSYERLTRSFLSFSDNYLGKVRKDWKKMSFRTFYVKSKYSSL